MDRCSVLIPLSFIIISLSVSTISPQIFVGNIKHPVGLAWTGENFIVSYRDGGTKLLSIAIDGKIETFAKSFNGTEEVYIAISDGMNGFEKGQIYVSSADTIYEIDPSGTMIKPFSKPSGGTQIEYITFGKAGEWPYLLYALTTDGGVWAIDSNGRATRLASLGKDLKPEGLTFASSNFGYLSNSMIISLESGHRIVALSASNKSKIIPIADFPDEAPERVLTIPDNMDLYVAKYDEGTIVRFPSSKLSQYSGNLLVITEGESGQIGSLTVLAYNGTSVSKIVLFQERNPHFEGAVFAPSTLIVAGEAKPSYTNYYLIIIVVGLAIIALVLARRRKLVQDKVN